MNIEIPIRALGSYYLYIRLYKFIEIRKQIAVAALSQVDNFGRRRISVLKLEIRIRL